MPATYPTPQTQLLSTVKVHSLPTSSFMAMRWHFCGVPFATNSGGQFFFCWESPASTRGGYEWSTQLEVCTADPKVWSFACTPHWLKTTQMAGLSLKSWMAGRCHLGGHWRRGSRSENVPLAYATGKIQCQYFKTGTFQFFSPQIHLLPQLFYPSSGEVEKQMSLLGKGGVTLGCPDHVGGGEYHVSRRDSMEGREMEGHTSGLFFQAFEQKAKSPPGKTPRNARTAVFS